MAGDGAAGAAGTDGTAGAGTPVAGIAVAETAVAGISPVVMASDERPPDWTAVSSPECVLAAGAASFASGATGVASTIVGSSPCGEVDGGIMRGTSILTGENVDAGGTVDADGAVGAGGAAVTAGG